jgi:hypothetical protein
MRTRGFPKPSWASQSTTALESARQCSDAGDGAARGGMHAAKRGDEGFAQYWRSPSYIVLGLT